MAKLKEGEEVIINIPFSYNIGEEGPTTNKVLETIKDCMDEVRAEIDGGCINGVDVLLEEKTEAFTNTQLFRAYVHTFSNSDNKLEGAMIEVLMDRFEKFKENL